MKVSSIINASDFVVLTLSILLPLIYIYIYSRSICLTLLLLSIIIYSVFVSFNVISLTTKPTHFLTIILALF